MQCDRCGWSLVEKLPPAGPPDTAFPLAFDMAYEKALQLVNQGDLAAAREMIESALHVAETPMQRGEAIAFRGYLKLKTGDAPGAEKDCSEALQIGWWEHRVLAWRAAARGLQNRWPEAVDDLHAAGARGESEARRYAGFVLDYLQRANQWYATLVQQSPSRVSHWLDRGWVRMRCGERNGATEDFNRALDLDPACHRAALGLALLALEQRENRRAIELASRASVSGDLDLQWQALACRAEANHQAGRLMESRADLERLSQLAGEDFSRQIALARLRSSVGDLTLALGDLRKLLSERPELADAWLLKGQLYLRLGNHRVAQLRFQEALRQKPDDALALTGLGQALAALGKTDQALAAFSRARTADSQLADAWIGQAQMHIAAQRLDLALADIERALALDDHRAESLGVRGQVRLGLCEYREAVEDFSRAIELARDRQVRADLLYRRGTALHELGELDASLADFVSCSQLQPDLIGPWVWRAAVHSRLQQWNEAVADLQQVLRFRSDQARSYLTLARPVAHRCIEYFTRRIQRAADPATGLFRHRGLAHEFLGNVFQAIEDYRVVLERERGEPHVTLRMAKLLTQLGQNQAAVDYLSRLIRRNHDHHAARYVRALARVALGDHERALSDAVKAIQTAPDVARYRLLRGELRMRQGDLERARVDFDRAIWLDSNDPNGWSLRATAYQKGGDIEQAIDDLSRAIDLAGEPIELLARRGSAWLKINRAEEAIADFDRCIRRQPGNVPAVTGRALALTQRARAQEALQWLTKSMHRFSEPLDIARILLTRGKIFYHMGSSANAVADFTLVVRLVMGDPAAESVARLARALAQIQHGSFDRAARDLKKFLLYRPDHRSAQRIQAWLSDRSQPPPPILQQPARIVRLDRPAASGPAIPVGAASDSWRADPPFDTWIVRDEEDREFGPVPKGTLDKWASQGRLQAGMKVLRGDWSRWKRIEKVYPALQQAPAPEEDARAATTR